MSRKINLVVLDSISQKQLELGYEKGITSRYRKRCKMILLKSEGYSSSFIGKLLKVCEPTVNVWIHRYTDLGISGLITQKGQGRKLILDVQQDTERIIATVKLERQRLAVAKSILENELNKEFSLPTLKRFLKNLSAVTNA